jgi:hypothetical protein
VYTLPERRKGCNALLVILNKKVSLYRCWEPTGLDFVLWLTYNYIICKIQKAKRIKNTKKDMFTVNRRKIDLSVEPEVIVQYNLDGVVAEARKNEERIEAIKNAVAEQYDNLTRPIPLMYQLVSPEGATEE